MKAGTESKTKTYMAIGLAVLAVFTVVYELVPSFSSGSSAAPAAASTGKTKGLSLESLDPRLRLDLLATSEDVKYQGNGKNIFRTAPEIEIAPKVTVPPLLTQQEQQAKQNVYIPPPPPPPITLKYFGITNSKGEKPKAFLSQGDDVWIAHEGDVVNRHYKIVRISPKEVEVEDLLNNNRQSIPLTQG
jgi:hypothetical protein